MVDQQLSRARTFLRAVASRQAAQVVAVPGGFAVLDPRYAGSYHHNRLLVDATADPGSVMAAADRVIGGAGMAHRMVVVDDDPGDDWFQAFRAAGYQHTVDLVMCRPVDGSAPAPAVPVHLVGPAELRDVDLRYWRRNLPAASPTVIGHLVERRAAVLRGAPLVRFLAVRDATGAVLSRGDWYADPAAGLAQVEELATDPEHGGRGYAKAIMAEGMRLAADAGCDLMIVVAVADDWPRHLYARLGYTEVGRMHLLLRMPVE